MTFYKVFMAEYLFSSHHSLESALEYGKNHHPAPWFCSTHVIWGDKELDFGVPYHIYKTDGYKRLLFSPDELAIAMDYLDAALTDLRLVYVKESYEDCGIYKTVKIEDKQNESA